MKRTSNDIQDVIRGSSTIRDNNSPSATIRANNHKCFPYCNNTGQQTQSITEVFLRAASFMKSHQTKHDTINIMIRRYGANCLELPEMKSDSKFGFSTLENLLEHKLKRVM